MALQMASLNSGSNGNCYYIGNDSDAVLIDVGISCRETEIRMKKIGLSMNKVKAIFVSHEHTDHIKGISVLANKYKLPVFITTETGKKGPRLIKHLSRSFSEDQAIQIGSIQVIPFKKEHDAVDPYSFMVSHEGINIGIITDIGTVCERVIHYFKYCHAAFLESNYDEAMLENGRYPFILKERIRNGKGHISNKQALELFINHRPPFMSHLFLSHLSKENNDPDLVKSLFTPHASATKIIIASRFEATEVHEINNEQSVLTYLRSKPTKALQLGLFEGE